MRDVRRKRKREGRRRLRDFVVDARAILEARGADG
jgi:hypothetical protein